MPGHRSRRTGTRADVPNLLRDEVAHRGEELLARKFRPLLGQESRAREQGFNYAVALFTEWRGRSFYLCAKYRPPRGRPKDEFVVRTTRLEYAGGGRFNLAYFRHTNRWQPVYFGLTLKECFAAVEDEEIFWPLT